jgi:hypothetical protein
MLPEFDKMHIWLVGPLIGELAGTLIAPGGPLFEEFGIKICPFGP